MDKPNLWFRFKLFNLNQWLGLSIMDIFFLSFMEFLKKNLFTCLYNIKVTEL